MSRLVAMLVVVSSLAVVPAPAGAQPFADAFAGRGHAIEMGQPDGHPFEARMFGFTGDVLFSMQPVEDEDFGCLEIFKDAVLELACGTFAIDPAPALQGTNVAATLDSEIYDYVNDPVWGPTLQFRGMGTMSFDLVLRGVGDPRLAHSEHTGVGVCGLPPETRGAFVFGEVLVDRAAAPEGTISTSALGDLDAAGLGATLRDMTALVAGACV